MDALLNGIKYYADDGTGYFIKQEDGSYIGIYETGQAVLFDVVGLEDIKNLKRENLSIYEDFFNLGGIMFSLIF